MMKQQRVVPDIILHNALISACEKGHQLEQALGIFRGMQQQGGAPNVITYSALISACEKGHQLEQALKLF